MAIAPHAAEIERRLREDVTLQDLADSLARTRVSVAQLWVSNKMPHYTDHSDRHSYRVADLAHKLATKRRAGEVTELSLLESYLLEMAAWAHDIGMQNIGAPDSAGPTPIDPDEVRTNHPQVSHDAILNVLTNGFNLDHGIPPNRASIIEFIAMLALAHGTGTYAHAVADLAKIPKLYGYTVRGPLLAALLLMADELDLCDDRVPAGVVPYQMSAKSQAHWLKHECVTNIDIEVNDRGHGEGEMIQLIVTLRTFANLSKNDVGRVAEWISDKLIAQIALTEGAIVTGFKNLYHFDRRIDFIVTEGRGIASHRVSDEVLAIIEADNARARLINHTDCLDTALEQLAQGKSVILVGHDSDEEEDGREDLFDLVCAKQTVGGAAVRAVVERRPGESSTVASDLLARWLQNSHLDQATVNEHELARRSILLEALVEAVASATAPTVFALSGLNKLSSDHRTWLLGEAFPRLRESGEVRFLISSDQDSDALSLDPAGWHEQRVGTTPPAELRAYLDRYLPSWAGRGFADSLTYRQARRHRAILELWAS